MKYFTFCWWYCYCSHHVFKVSVCGSVNNFKRLPMSPCWSILSNIIIISINIIIRGKNTPSLRFELSHLQQTQKQQTSSWLPSHFSHRANFSLLFNFSKSTLCVCHGVFFAGESSSSSSSSLPASSSTSSSTSSTSWKRGKGSVCGSVTRHINPLLHHTAILASAYHLHSSFHRNMLGATWCANCFYLQKWP